MIMNKEKIINERHIKDFYFYKILNEINKKLHHKFIYTSNNYLSNIIKVKVKCTKCEKKLYIRQTLCYNTMKIQLYINNMMMYNNEDIDNYIKRYGFISCNEYMIQNIMD